MDIRSKGGGDGHKIKTVKERRRGHSDRRALRARPRCAQPGLGQGAKGAEAPYYPADAGRPESFTGDNASELSARLFPTPNQWQPPLYFRGTINYLRSDNPVRIFLVGAQRLVTELACGSNVRVVTYLVSAAIALFGTLGSLHAFGFVNVHPFDLDGEWRFPPYFSGGLLFAAAALAFMAGDAGLEGGNGQGWLRHLGWLMDRGQSRTWWRLMGLFFAFMATDELVAIHERLDAATGVDWQELYLPIAFLGGLAWLFTAWRLWRHRVGYLLYGAGAVAWFLSQVLEAIQWGVGDEKGGKVAIYNYLMIAEEVGEMIGSMLFCLAILVAIQCAYREQKKRPAVVGEYHDTV